MTAPIKNKLSRAEKNELTRKNLFDAAVKVVGEIGYRDASVADITARADIAQGTFYNYFESKQDILDQLLPELGEILLEYLGEQVGETTFLEREEKSIRAYFQFIRSKPEFYRILTEAQVYAPQSFKKHFENLIRNYTRALARTKENGYLVDYSPEEFETIASILLGARVYLTSQFCFRTNKVRPVPEQVIQTFMKFVTIGLGGAAPSTNRKKTVRQSPARAMELPRREVVQTSDQELLVNYQTPVELIGTSSAESDFFIQQLSSDLLRGATESLLAGEVRLRNTSIQLTSEEVPSVIAAMCRIDHKTSGEGIVSLKLNGIDDKAQVCLASGHAGFVRI